MQEPLVSVIIPCFNHGKYIFEAVESVLNQSYINVEIIIVNDGSTDNSKELIDQIENSKVTIIHTNNNGLSHARNIGINASNGKYILPLDADDKIDKIYITKAVKILQADNNIGILYGRVWLFGEKNEEWILEKFSTKSILFANQIYASAIFRKDDFILLGGYDKRFCYGWEDWDFWLSIISLKRSVYFIDEVVFYYRIINNSMVRSMTELQKKITRQLIYNKHFKLFESLFEDPITLYYDYRYYKNISESLLNNKIIKMINFISKKVNTKSVN